MDFFTEWEGDGLLSPPPLLLAHMIKSDYKLRNIFENYLSHNYVKIHPRLHLIELFLKNFLGRAYIPSNHLAVKLNSVIRTARQRKRSVLQYLSIISKIIPPYLNMDIFFL